MIHLRTIIPPKQWRLLGGTNLWVNIRLKQVSLSISSFHSFSFIKHFSNVYISSITFIDLHQRSHCHSFDLTKTLQLSDEQRERIHSIDLADSTDYDHLLCQIESTLSSTHQTNSSAPFRIAIHSLGSPGSPHATHTVSLLIHHTLYSHRVDGLTRFNSSSSLSIYTLQSHPQSPKLSSSAFNRSCSSFSSNWDSSYIDLHQSPWSPFLAHSIQVMWLRCYVGQRMGVWHSKALQAMKSHKPLFQVRETLSQLSPIDLLITPLLHCFSAGVLMVWFVWVQIIKVSVASCDFRQPLLSHLRPPNSRSCVAWERQIVEKQAEWTLTWASRSVDGKALGSRWWVLASMPTLLQLLTQKIIPSKLRLLWMWLTILSHVSHLTLLNPNPNSSLAFGLEARRSNLVIVTRSSTLETLIGDLTCSQTWGCRTVSL